jgi:hypothetical protein
MLYEIGSTNLEESVDVLQDLILAHIRAKNWRIDTVARR